MTNKSQAIELNEFSARMSRLLQALVAKGQDGKIELNDLGDFIGRLIMTDSEDLTELEEAYVSFCEGIYHGIGLSHQELN